MPRKRCEQFDVPSVSSAAHVGQFATRYAAFEPHMDEYLDDETEWIKNVLDKMCKAWDAKASNGTAGRLPCDA
jgi:hypothetical protein